LTCYQGVHQVHYVGGVGLLAGLLACIYICVVIVHRVDGHAFSGVVDEKHWSVVDLISCSLELGYAIKHIGGQSTEH